MPDILRSFRDTPRHAAERLRIPWNPTVLLFLVAAVLGLALAGYLSTLPQDTASETEADLTLVFPRN